ncbi:TBC1 domain family member 19 isoform X2 [Teleopsis dalmanni]|uniref:TBC1 domain family member 19 isoform X2 n=1 Tax=Teleopsis dalmanni TaxID=139649 RepID=UPI0018CE19AC|nr:TBC1 domain family member 19 isoform X2 [Teleopsis dalmanni]
MFHYLCYQSCSHDPLSYLRRAGVQWNRRVRKSLNAMCNDLSVPVLGQQRTLQDREEVLTKWDELSNYTIELSNFRPVYAPKDLLDVLLSLKGPARQSETKKEQLPKWEFSHINLPVKNLFELRAIYVELTTKDQTSTHEMVHKCKRILRSKHATLAQQLLKKGMTPAPFRGQLWTYVLGSQVTDTEVNYWNKLKNSVITIDHIADKLVFKDIQLTASNDDQYFVFEDILYQILLCFSRDEYVDEQIVAENYVSRGKYYDAPPSGVVPFHGICMFAAPFCYLYKDPIQMYFTFRAFYIRFFHPLITIQTHPQGIVSLCLLYERLLQTHEPELWSHLRQLEIHPIKLVFKWLMRAFSGHLHPDQLLILWDLILAYDSLEILPLFCTIILSFRKECLLQVNSWEQIENVLADLSSIQVIPLIQLTLNRDS